MHENLVIVESPAKAKTIEKFLGKDYKVMSSYGHIRDLKKKEISIDEASLEPEYEIPEEKKKLVAELKAQAAKAGKVWLASDEDREGEAISWHLCEVLGLDEKKTSRIVFHEITKPAILEAIENPRHLNMNLVDAQQARRVLDRLVGFKLSPVLWRKVKPALSAGRVQSVAVRLIVEREREIYAFNSEPYYRINAIFTIEEDGHPVEIKAELDKRFTRHEDALAFLEVCRNAEYKVADIQHRPLHRTPAPPFTTSTLQQEAARRLGFTVSQTMMVAQHLYENGLITYMRTDSVNLSKLCIGATKEEILKEYGEEYLHTRNFQTKSKGAQEAHEAIRPTYMNQAKIEGTVQERRLYDLIRKRTIASQMADALIEKTQVNISVSGATEQFVVQGEVVKFDGFMKVYAESRDDDNEQENMANQLPQLTVGQTLERREIVSTERFSQSPIRYTEASLVHKLEELGIGRPSTYAPTISTIQ
jgi:DNA topoisomerase-1